MSDQEEITYTRSVIGERHVDAQNPDVVTPGVTREVAYYNYTSRNVTVSGRAGLKFVVKYKTFGYKREFIIRETYKIHRDAYQDIHTQLNNLDESNPANAKLLAMRESFNNQYAVNTTGYSSQHSYIYVYIEHRVSDEEIKNGETLYLTCADVMLSTKHPNDAPNHPYSDVSQFNRRYDHILESKTATAVVLDLVDNEGLIGVRYYHMTGKIFKIRPVKDTTRNSGLYYGHTDHGELKLTHHPLDDLESFGLYKTIEEAQTGGDVKLLRQEELARLQHEVQLITVEATRSKAALEKLKAKYGEDETKAKAQILELEVRVKQADKNNQLLAAEIDRQKKLRDDEIAKVDEMRKERDEARKEKAAVRNDYYDARSSDRKDTSELIKFVPTVIAACLAGYIAYNKWRSS